MPVGRRSNSLCRTLCDRYENTTLAPSVLGGQTNGTFKAMPKISDGIGKPTSITFGDDNMPVKKTTTAEEEKVAKRAKTGGTVFV